MLDLTGVTHSYRFTLPGAPRVTGARGRGQRVRGQHAVVKVDDRGRAFSVIVAGPLADSQQGGLRGSAIFYRQDFDRDPVARELAEAAEREFAILRQPVAPTLPDWPDPDARPTY